MASDDDSNIIEQVDSRLDDLFGEEDVNDSGSTQLKAETPPDGFGTDETSTEAPAPEKPRGDAVRPQETAVSFKTEIDADDIESSPIKELKSIILSLEWEITDPVMEKLEEEIRKMELLAKDDKILLAYLQLLGSLGKYIRKKLAQAHVDSITLLHSVYESLEKAMLSKEMSDAAKKKMLIHHVAQYKKLKQDIQATKNRARRAKPSATRPQAPPAPETGASPGTLPREVPNDFKDMAHMTRELLHAMKDIQQTIQHEFAMLRGDIRRLMDEK